jgi:hypothetical protein
MDNAQLMLQQQHQHLLHVLVSVVNPASPAELQEAMDGLTEHLNHPQFLEMLCMVYSGITLNVPEQHVAKVRELAGVTLKGRLSPLLLEAGRATMGRVQRSIIATLADPVTAAVSANLVSGLCAALLASSLDVEDSGEDQHLEALWPGLVGALLGTLDAAAAGGGGGGHATASGSGHTSASGALLATRQLATGGFLQGGASGREPPALHFMTRLVQCMSASDAHTRLMAVETGHAILVTTPGAVGPRLPAYLAALYSVLATSEGTPQAPATACALLNTFSALAVGAPTDLWPNLPGLMGFVLHVLAAGPEGGKQGRAAGHFVYALLGAAQKCDAGWNGNARAGGGWGGGEGGGGGGSYEDAGGGATGGSAPGGALAPYHCSLRPYLEPVLRALLGGAALEHEVLLRIPRSLGGRGEEVDEAGGGGSYFHAHTASASGGGAGQEEDEGAEDDEEEEEEEEEEEAESCQGGGLGEDSVRNVYIGVLSRVVEAFPEEAVAIFLPLLHAHLASARAAGAHWTLTEAGLSAFTAVYIASGDVGQGGRQGGAGDVLHTCRVLLPHCLQLLRTPASPPFLRGTVAALLESQAEWLLEAQKSYPAALAAAGGVLAAIPQEQLLAGIHDPQGQALLALAECLASRDTSCVRSAGRAIVCLCGEDSGTSAAPSIAGILNAALTALAAASPGAPPPQQPAHALSPAAAAALRCELWQQLRDIVNAVWKPLAEEDEFNEVRGALAGVLAVTLQRLAGADPRYATREASMFMACAESFVHPAGERSALLLGLLVGAAQVQGEACLAEHAEWAGEEAAQAAREAAVGRGGGARGRVSHRPPFDATKLTSALKLACSAVHTLGAVAGVDRAAQGLARLRVTTRAGAEVVSGAATTLAALAGPLLRPGGMLLGALGSGLLSDSVTVSVHQLLGEVVRSRVLCPGLGEPLGGVLVHLVGGLERALGAMGARTTAAQRAGAAGAAPAAEGGGAAPGAAAEGGGAGGGTGGHPWGSLASHSATTRYCPGQGALGWMVWAAGQFVARVDAGSAAAVGATLAPVLAVLLRKDFGASKGMRENGACALARLCARGAAQEVQAACAAPGESGAGVGWEGRLFGLALGLVVDTDRVDTAYGLCALAGVAPQCLAEMPLLLQLVAESHAALAPEGLPSALRRVVADMCRREISDEEWATMLGTEKKK